MRFYWTFFSSAVIFSIHTNALAQTTNFDFENFKPIHDTRKEEGIQSLGSAYSIVFEKNPANSADIKFTTYEYDTSTNSYTAVNYGYTHSSNYVSGSTVNLYTTTQTPSSGIITGDFFEITTTNSGSAIRTNSGTNISVIGDFIGNNGNIGGAVSNGSAVISSILGNFIGNSANQYGGAFTNWSLGTTNSVTANFINNYASQFGGAIMSTGYTEILNSNFIANTAGVDGGAIYNEYTTSIITNSNFIGNIANRSGGAVYNINTLTNITGIFIKNSAGTYGGALYNSGTMNGIRGDFIGNTAGTHGGAIYNSGTSANIVNSSFYDNTATSGQGGAIYATGNTTITANNYNSIFSGNADSSGNNAIYVGNSSRIITLESINNGLIQFDDTIIGIQGYTLNILGDSSSSIIFNNDISNANIVIDASSGNDFALDFTDGLYLNNNNSLEINNGSINIINLGSTDDIHFRNLTLNGGKVNLNNVDVDLVAQTMGKINADTYTSGTTSISVNKLNVLTDQTGSTDVNFADLAFASQVGTNVSSALGPVYRYRVNYDDTTGNFNFVSTGYNPSIQGPSIAAAAAVSALGDEIYTRVLSDIDGLHIEKSPAVYCNDAAKAFVKTFGSDENLDLKVADDVDARYFGIIGGIESNKIIINRNKSYMYNIYGAYANASYKFSDDKINQNNFFLGGSLVFYDGNFFVGTTINGRIIRNEDSGKEKFDAYAAGAGIKLGYNYDFGNDLMIQPNFFGGYTYITSDDYMTSYDADVRFGHMHNFEVAPGLKIYKNFGCDLRFDIHGRYVFIFNEGDEVKADNYRLKKDEIKDYAEYGFGIEKLWLKQSSSAFAQINRRDGGREGWSFIIGAKWFH